MAFLQNCWFRPGTDQQLIVRYLTDQNFRRMVLARSMTGRRLLNAFGPIAYRKIWWDNASMFVGRMSAAKADPDINYMLNQLEIVRPRVVLTFGNIAKSGFLRAHSGPYQYAHHHCPHPNTRGITQAQLNEFARKIIAEYL